MQRKGKLNALFFEKKTKFFIFFCSKSLPFYTSEYSTTDGRNKCEIRNLLFKITFYMH